ncbi:unannotated protein [freshwater metagenome]|uniref:Unannotated protein n=1 Tax=freshwater metagenome TaxID=449393 RepID=A0A6J7M572_9ZZZZ
MLSPFVTRSAFPFTEHSEHYRYTRRPAFRQMVVRNLAYNTADSIVIQYRGVPQLL